ncbi:hypothetical protein BDI4_600042 [Burkholderia diffusa]|nr:hypothetical protein BDI4_600042 [Burkholderia diffusa]
MTNPAARHPSRGNHRPQRWVLGVTGGRRHKANRSASTLPYASRAPTIATRRRDTR